MILEIIQAIENENERHAISEIFRLYYPRMKAVAYNVLHNREDAEDAAMNAMKYMCEHPDLFTNYDTSPQTISLIYLCVKSAAIDIYRKNKRKNNLFFSLDELKDHGGVNSSSESNDLILNIIITEETKKILAQAIEELEDIYKIPILLKYSYQMKNIDIAELTHLDVNMVNSRIFRAKNLLRKKMKELGCVE